MVRFDYACKKCEKTFTAWSDEAKICAYCGSKRVFKVFLTPTAYSSGKASQIDKLAERQLDAAGLSNYTNVGGTVRRTRKTDPKMLEAVAAAKAANVPLPIETGPSGRVLSRPLQMTHPLVQGIASRGKGHLTQNPQGSGALVQGVLNSAKQITPLEKLTGERRYPKEKVDEMSIVRSLMRK